MNDIVWQIIPVELKRMMFQILIWMGIFLGTLTAVTSSIPIGVIMIALECGIYLRGKKYFQDDFDSQRLVNSHE